MRELDEGTASVNHSNFSINELANVASAEEAHRSQRHKVFLVVFLKKCEVIRRVRNKGDEETEGTLLP